MPDTKRLAGWVRHHASTIGTLDPGAPLTDLEPLRRLVGDARVIAVGESAHHVREFYLLRHRILRFLVERCGFTVYAFEAPFTEARAIDEWVRGGPGDIAEIAAAGGILGRCQEMYDTLAWMRSYNAGADRPVRFAGAVAGSGGGSPLPELDELARYLHESDPDALPLLEQAVAAAKHFHDPRPMRVVQAYPAAEQAVRDAHTAALSRLLARMDSMTAYQTARGAGQEHARALTYLRGAWHLDHFHRDLAGHGLAIGTTHLDAFMAESVLRRLEQEPDAKVVLALHNVHIRTTPADHDGPAGLFPAGYQLASALGDDYVAIGVTCGRGRAARGLLDPDQPSGFRFEDRALPEAEPGSVETAFSGLPDITLADLRSARHDVEDAESFQRMREEDYFMGLPVLDALDVIAYVPETGCTDYPS